MRELWTDLSEEQYIALFEEMKKVGSGWGQGSILDYLYSWNGIDPDYIAEDLVDAVGYSVLNHQG
ncbi:hypothetical protein FGG79_02695 [Bacillus sp. BHET2]|nr:hypothetical protein FGG79_02695 [Bacillus sp. BHET2]